MFNFIKTRTQKQARTQRVYTAIKNMKDMFSKGFEVTDTTTGQIVNISCFMHDLPAETGLTIYDYCKFLQSKYNKLTTITDKIAFLTVLSLGHFSDDSNDETYSTFYTPSTSDCMKAYKKIEKKLKRRQRITVTFSLGNNHYPHDPYDIIGYDITVDFFSAKPIYCKYWDTEGVQCVERY